MLHYCRRLVLIFLFCLIGISISTKIEARLNQPFAVDGILDLRNWDFEKQGVIELKGEWDFYWKQLYSFREITHQDPPPKSGIIELPSIWNDFELDGKPIGKNGFATFALKILLKKTDQILAVKTSVISTSFDLFVNEKKIGSNGTVGISSEDAAPNHQPLVCEFYPGNDQNILILHVANYFHAKGGPRRILQLGTFKQLANQREKNQIFDMFLFGSLFMIGLYYLGLFSARTSEKAALYFSLFCFIVSIRVLINGDMPMLVLFPDFPYWLALLLEYLTAYLGAPVFCSFIAELFPKRFSNRLLKTLQIVSLVFIIVTVLTPSSLYTHLLGYYHYVTVFYCIYSVYITFRAVISKEPNAVLFIFGFSILFLTIVNDILFTRGIITTGTLSHLGLFVFVLTQAFVLTKRHARALDDVKQLTLELKNKNFKLRHYGKELEKTVKARTIDLEQALKQTNKSKRIVEKVDTAKSEFLANLSHELRTPMHGILGFSKLGFSKSSSLNKNKLGEFFEQIYSSGSSLMTLLDELLSFSKLEAGMIVYNYSKATLTSLVNSVITEMQPVAANKKISIHFDTLPKGIDVIEADIGKINQVIRNLLSNALRYSEQGSYINVQIRLESDEYITSVQDYGVGIPESEIETIFDKYVQSSETKSNSGGTGLGLSISHKIIADHGGKIWAKNNPEKGTTFHFTLPKNPAHQNYSSFLTQN